MIRLIQRRLIIPRGDTGTFTVPALSPGQSDSVGVFTIFDPITKTRVFQKQVELQDGVFNIEFDHGDTVNLQAGDYLWDIKFYVNPIIENGKVIDGTEIDSYYAAFQTPKCEIRETGDDFMVIDGQPAKIEDLNIILAATSAANAAKIAATEQAEIAAEKASEAAERLAQMIAAIPTKVSELENDSGYLQEESVPAWAKAAEKPSYTPQEVGALPSDTFIPSKVSDLEDDSGHYVKPASGIPASDLEETYLTQHQDISMKANSADLAAVATSGDYSDLANTPYIPTKTSDLVNDSSYPVDASYVHTDNNYTTAEKEKLASIAAGAEVNVNADWNATSGDAQILNKPTNVSAFENDVGYLTEHQDISGKANSADLAAVATSGSYNDLEDKPFIPSKVSDLTDDSGHYTKPVGGIPASDLAETYLTSFIETDPTVPEWAKAATKPSYTAAEVGAPTVQEMNSAISTAIGNVNSFDMAVVQALPEQDISTHTIYLVPKTGETNDVYDEYVYINDAWEMVGNTQIDLSNYALKSELPTKVSELSNDSGYLTSYTETDPTVPQWAKASTKPSYTAAEVGALPSDTHIPSTTAELTNDAGFITVEEVPEVPVQDIQVDGTSIVDAQGVADIPLGELADRKADVIIASASGAIASFADGADDMPLRDCIVQIEPVQDLHGYDHPWPAGGGKNLLNANLFVKTSTTAGNDLTVSDETITMTWVNGGIIGSNRERQTIPAGTYTISAVGTNKDLVYARMDAVDNFGTIATAQLGSSKSFTAEKDFYVSIYGAYNNPSTAVFKLQLESGSTATAWSPYSNICPISGWTGAKVQKAGKNLLPMPITSGSYANSVTVTVNDDLSFYITKANGNGWTVFDLGTFILKAGIYTLFESDDSSQNASMSLINASTGAEIISTRYNSRRVITLEEDTEVKVTYGRAASATNVLTKLMIFAGNTATVDDYEPYQGQTYDIAFPTEAGTVYGGTLDVVSGELVVEYGSIIFDGSADEPWVPNGTDGYFLNKGLPNGSYRIIASDHYKAVKNGGTSAMSEGECNMNATEWALQIFDTNLLGYSSFSDKLSHSPVTIIYKMRTPIVYSLTPQEIKTLLGQNNIWTDCGDTVVQYPADTKAYVDSSVPAIPVTDVQVNGTSILNNGVANVPLSNGTTPGVVRCDRTVGAQVNGNGYITIVGATGTTVKGGKAAYNPITPVSQHDAAFYGLAKAAGHDEKDSTEPLGTYTPEAKGAIQSMLGVSDLIATEENNLIASKAYKVGDVFTANGKLYKATAAIAVDGAIITDGANANCVETSVGDGFVKKTDYATDENVGVVRAGGDMGLGMYGSRIFIGVAGDNKFKSGSGWYNAVTISKQHQATFYGLAKAAGADEKDSTLPIGTYTDTAKTAIRTMLGATSSNVIAVQDTQPTDTDTKIWLPETAPEGVEVPTMEDLGDYVKKTDIATATVPGIVKVGGGGYGISIGSDSILRITTATEAEIKTKSGSTAYHPITVYNLDTATFYSLASVAGDTTQSQSTNAIGVYTDEAKSAIQTMLGVPGDVQINGTSVVNDGIASIPIAQAHPGTNDDYGLVKINSNNGITISSDGCLSLVRSTETGYKTANDNYKVITPYGQHLAVFYGLAKASGDTTQSSSSNAVGVYTDNAKASIKAMLGIQDGSTGTVDISSTTPTITAVENTRYVCGEVTSLNFTPPASGISIVRFTSGSTVTVLTIPSTVKFPEWFDPTSLETNTIYEICVTDGVYGAVMSWAL